MHPRLFGLLIGALVVAATALPGCSSDSSDAEDTALVDHTGDGTTFGTYSYQADVRWGPHGVPYITGSTLANGLFGQGYAAAKLNICTIANKIIEANSRLAEFYGPGPGNTWVELDFGYKGMDVRRIAEQAWPELSVESRIAVEAFAAGYNAYVREVGPSGLPERCRDAAWVEEITPLDLLTYYGAILQVASGWQLRSMLAKADPPNATGMATTPLDLQQTPAPEAMPELIAAAHRLDTSSERTASIGSNGWAIGRDRSAHGGGMVLGNPHFPWEGHMRWYETHLKVEGDFEAHGTGLYGLPLVLLGYNDKVAWTDTVSASRKFVVYLLKPEPGDLMKYRVGDTVYDVQEREETIFVKNEDSGALEPVTRKFYRTHLGPVLELPGFGDWREDQLFTLFDGNADNKTVFDFFLALDRAQSIDEVEAANREHAANPWINMMFADAAGDVLYSECTSVPNISPAGWAAYEASLEPGGPIIFGLGAQLGFYVFDGSTPDTMPVDDERARAPGLVPWDETPHLRRTDYVFNANESHWLSHETARLEGYPRIYGDEGTARNLRTRMNLKMLTEQTAEGASGADGKFTLTELRDTIFNNRVMAAELMRDEVVSRCAAQSSVQVGGGTVDLKPACDVLAAWDGRMDKDSAGAVLWREWLSGWSATTSAEPYFAEGFDTADPVGTPNTLRTIDVDGTDAALLALAHAADVLTGEGHALDVRLGALQFHEKRTGETFEVHGGYGYEGAFNIVGYSTSYVADSRFDRMGRGSEVPGSISMREEGYPINYGSSFVMAVALHEDKPPEAAALITYSQSGEPDSPWYQDQTARYEDKDWRTVPWTDADLQAAGISATDAPSWEAP